MLGNSLLRGAEDSGVGIQDSEEVDLTSLSDPSSP